MTEAAEPKPDSPTGQEQEGTSRFRAPVGEAAAKIILDRATIRPTEQTSFRLVNGGQVDLMVGPAFDTERWNGQAWLALPPPRIADMPYLFPDVGQLLRPGEHSQPQKWPLSGMKIEPGWYRIVKAVRCEGGGLHRHPSRELVARARVRVAH